MTVLAANRLDGLYRQRTQALASGAVLLYAMFTIAHGFVLTGPVKPIMMGLAALTTAAAYLLRRWLMTVQGPYTQVEAAAAALFTLATANVTLHAVLLQSPEQSGFLPIMAIGFALLAPSRRLLAFSLIAQAVAAGVILAFVNPIPGVTTFVFVMVCALFGAWLGGLFTLKTAEALLAEKHIAEQLSAELEERVAARTQALAAATEAAQAANSAKSQFLAVMSHELRTPLNAIIGYSEILKEAAIEDGRTQDQADLNRVLSASKRLLHMISDVLDLSKIEAGRLHLSPAPTDIAALARDAVDSVRPAAQARNTELTLTVAENVGLILTDGFRVSQCLLNLLSNAVKFTRDGAVRVTVERNGPTISFTVADTGIGISPGQAQTLFQPFVQADSSTTREYGGTGLGLSVTRELAHLLGGDVTLKSALGEGSVFTLTIAAVDDAAAAQAA